jgi:hypothetical protein
MRFNSVVLSFLPVNCSHVECIPYYKWHILFHAEIGYPIPGRRGTYNLQTQLPLVDMT